MWRYVTRSGDIGKIRTLSFLVAALQKQIKFILNIAYCITLFYYCIIYSFRAAVFIIIIITLPRLCLDTASGPEDVLVA